MPVDPVFAADLANDLSAVDYVRLLHLFRQDVTQLSEAISRAAAAADEAGFRRAAHGLAGAAGAVGAQELEAACRTVMAPRLINEELAASAERIAALAAATLADIATALDRAAGR